MKSKHTGVTAVAGAHRDFLGAMRPAWICSLWREPEGRDRICGGGWARAEATVRTEDRLRQGSGAFGRREKYLEGREWATE